MTETASIDTLGIIAGSRSLPFLVAREARAAGVRRLVALAFHGETDPALAEWVDEIEWVRVGQVNRAIRALKVHGVRHCVMAGQIAPKNLFDLRPDFRALNLLLKLRHKNAHSVFGALAEELRKDGIELIEATPWLRPHMPGPAFHLGPALTPARRQDLALGFRIAKEISRLEIGQTVVVKDGAVLAVEAFEGTDACLRRGGNLAGPKGGAVAVKVAREGHDMRFDIPCFGRRTVEVCAEAGVAVFAVEPGRAILLEREEVESLVRRHRITLTTTAAAED